MWNENECVVFVSVAWHFCSKPIFDFSHCRLRRRNRNKPIWRDFNIRSVFIAFCPSPERSLIYDRTYWRFFKRILLSVKTYTVLFWFLYDLSTDLKISYSVYWLKTNVIKINKCNGIKINWKYPPIFSLYANFISLVFIFYSCDTLMYMCMLRVMLTHLDNKEKTVAG